jgi:class 3 adenylate cyclase
MGRRRPNERGLATLLFTDIVGSSEVAVELGDRRWRHLQARHHAEVRKQLKRHGGREVDTAGDGFFATFGSPAAGVRCAFAIVRGVRELGLDIRAGLHIGEAELAGEKVGGIAVTTAQRVESAAEPGQVLATDTIVHLVAGSGFQFTDLGSRELKGVPGRWELFSLDAADGDSIGSPLDPTQAAEYRLRASAVEEATPVRRRIVWRGVTVAAVVLTVAVILVSRRQPNEQPRTPDTGPAVSQTLAVLSADSGEVLERPSGVVYAVVAGLKGTSGPIVLTAPAGAAHQAFAWIISNVPFGNQQRLQQLDQASGAVIDTSPLSTCFLPPGCLAESGGKVWFLVHPHDDPVAEGALAQSIDPTTSERAKPSLVSRDVSLGNPRGDVRGMASGDGALWIGDTFNGKVYRLDLRTKRVKQYSVGGSVDDLAFGGGYVWVIDGTTGMLTRVTPGDGRTTRRSLNTAGDLNSIATGGGKVWITDDTLDTVWRVSTDLNEVTSIPVGSRPDDVVYANGNVWVANYGDGSVSKVDPGLAQELMRYQVGIHPRALAAANGKLWVVGDVFGLANS